MLCFGLETHHCFIGLSFRRGRTAEAYVPASSPIQLLHFFRRRQESELLCSDPEPMIIIVVQGTKRRR